MSSSQGDGSEGVHVEVQQRTEMWKLMAGTGVAVRRRRDRGRANELVTETKLWRGLAVQQRRRREREEGGRRSKELRINGPGERTRQIGRLALGFEAAV